MFEIFFILGAALQILHVHTRDRSAPIPRWLLGAGSVLLGSMIIGLFAHLLAWKVIAESVFLWIILCMLLWAVALGFWSMLIAPVWKPWKLLAFQTVGLFIFLQVDAPQAWMIASITGFMFTLFTLLPTSLPLIWLRAILYAWSLVLTIAIEFLYILPLMDVMEPSPLQITLVGSAFFVLGATGLFTAKYGTMLVATMLRREKSYTDMFAGWIDTYFPRKEPLLQGLIPVLILAACYCLQVFDLLSADTATLLAVTAFLLHGKTEKKQQ